MMILVSKRKNLTFHRQTLMIMIMPKIKNISSMLKGLKRRRMMKGLKVRMKTGNLKMKVWKKCISYQSTNLEDWRISRETRKCSKN